MKKDENGENKKLEKRGKKIIKGRGGKKGTRLGLPKRGGRERVG